GRALLPRRHLGGRAAPRPLSAAPRARRRQGDRGARRALPGLPRALALRAPGHRGPRRRLRDHPARRPARLHPGARPPSPGVRRPARQPADRRPAQHRGQPAGGAARAPARPGRDAAHPRPRLGHPGSRGARGHRGPGPHPGRGGGDGGRARLPALRQGLHPLAPVGPRVLARGAAEPGPDLPRPRRVARGRGRDGGAARRGLPLPPVV
ncbi:MAG: Phosphohydrolase (MutT/nudix family protein), partial [uncultured Solirubrobacteraceae bacterium]